MKIETSLIQKLRHQTGVGVMDCKRALERAQGDINQAAILLQELAAKVAAAKAARATRAGVVECYLHGDGRIGVMLELRCETDFLAKSQEFRRVARELALQIASEAPSYVSSAQVPKEAIREIEQQAYQHALALGRPEGVIPQIQSGRVQKWLRQACLLEQPCLKQPELTVGQLLQALTAKSGESVEVVQFSRYQIE